MIAKTDQNIVPTSDQSALFLILSDKELVLLQPSHETGPAIA